MPRITQKQSILNHLQQHGTITSFECFSKLQVTDLQSYIRFLKQDGYNITDEWKERNGKRFKVYSLVVEEGQTEMKF